METGADDQKIEKEKNLVDEQSEDESVLSESWRRDSFSKGSLSSCSSSSSSSLRREFVKKKKRKKKILPFGIISPPYTKPGARDDEKEENRKSIDQEKSRLLGLQGSRSLTNTSNNEISATREVERTSSFQRPKLLDYDEVVARLAALRRR